MTDATPSNRRLGRAAIIVVTLILAMVMIIFVTFNISHYRAMQNDTAQSETAQNGATPAP